MTDKPILFSGPMIRALLEGRKTQTRRVMKVQPAAYAGGVHPDNVQRHPHPYIDSYCGARCTPQNPRGMTRDWCWWSQDDRCGPSVGRAPCVPGDRLWVRETWYPGFDYDDNDMPVGDRKIFYRATDNVGRWFDPDREETRDSPPWKPSILMPRAASRLTLTVSYIRAQRLQDISEEDAQSEGCIRLRSGRAVEVQGAQYAGNYWGSPNSWFRTIWAEIHGPDAWTENPWVWALTFTVEQRNIDAARQENAA